MNDDVLDALVTAAAPPTDVVDASPVIAASADLREAIVALPAAGRSRAGWGRWVAAAAVVVGVVGVGLVSLDGEDGSAYAAEVVEMAEASPRLLVEGWTVTRADDLERTRGELTFESGGRRIDLFWRSAAEHDGYVDDRAHSSDPPLPITVLGREGVLFRYQGSDDFTALWVDGAHALELRGEALDEAAFRAIAASLERVDVETWLDAMPASAVRPADQATVIAAMLDGIAQPAGWDPAVLDEIDGGVTDRYQLGARVAGAVACAWIDDWVEADAAGDSAAKEVAAQGLATSKQWPILIEMRAEGGYTDVLWEYVDDIVLRDGYSVYGGRDRIRNGGYRDSACLR